MCDKCGCGNVETFTIIPMSGAAGIEAAHEHEYHVHEHGGIRHSHEHTHARPHNHLHEPLHEHVQPHDHHRHEPRHENARTDERHTVRVNLPILGKNERLAERNRSYMKEHGLLAVNIVSSPGSGKTTLIAKTLEQAGAALQAAVIVGDLETANDAARLRGKGAPVVQVTTGAVCHLDAEMVGRAIEHMDINGRRLLIIENVGNLVCPAAYDLGESLRVVLISVTEGEDKPLKYPPIFRDAGAVIITKCDMIEASGVDLEELRRNIGAVAPEAEIIEVSTRTGQGLEQWIAMLRGLTLDVRLPISGTYLEITGQSNQPK